MNQYIDLSIKKIEIKNPKRDLKPIVNLQNKVILTLSHEEYYYPTDEKTIEESLKGDYILLGDRKSTRLNSSHSRASRMPSSA